LGGYFFQRDQYEELDGSQSLRQRCMLACVLVEQKKLDKTGNGAIRIWCNTIFKRPDALFRDDEITFNSRL